MSLNSTHQAVELEATLVSTHLVTTTTLSGKCNGQTVHQQEPMDMVELLLDQ